MNPSIARAFSFVSASILMALYLTLPARPAPPADQEETARALMRPVCKDPKARANLVAKLEKQEPEYRRSAVKWDIDMVCAQVDLPLTPVNDTADLSPKATHTNWIYHAHWNADGSKIISASRDGTVRIWDTQSGKTISLVHTHEQKPLVGGPVPGIVRSAIFVGDEKKIAVAADAQPISLYDVASGHLIATVPFKKIDPNESNPPYMAATSSGLLLLAGNADDVVAFDTAAMVERYRLPGHKPNATAVAVSETAGLVATGAEFKDAIARVSLWKLDTGEKVADFEANGDRRPSALAFSRDGAQLAVVLGGVVNVYAVADKSLTRTIVVHPFASAFDAAFTADGKGLISCQSHPILWDLATGKLVRHFGGLSDLCHSIDVSPDGRFAVTGSMGSDVRVWEIETGSFYRRLGIDVHPPG